MDMKPQEIILGPVTYELRRVFQGTRPLAELMAERLAQNIPDARGVDGGDPMKYNCISGPVHRRRRV